MSRWGEDMKLKHLYLATSEHPRYGAVQWGFWFDADTGLIRVRVEFHVPGPPAVYREVPLDEWDGFVLELTSDQWLALARAELRAQVARERNRQRALKGVQS